MERGKISSGQLAVLLFITIMSTSVLLVPAFTIQKARQSAWLSALVVPLLTGVFVIWICQELGRRFPQKTLPQYAEILLGKVLGKAVGIAFGVFFLTLNIVVAREFSDFLTNLFMPDTPAFVFITCITILGGYATLKGLEVIARMSQFILPLFLLTPLIIFLLSLGKVRLINIEPFLEGGIAPIINGSIIPSGWMGEAVLTAMLLPFINKPQKALKMGSLALAAAAIILATDTFTLLLVFGPDLAEYFAFPLVSLARYIYVADFIQRLEFLIMGLWVASMVVKVSMFYYLSCLGLAQAICLKKYAPLIWPVGLIQIVFATFLFSSTFQLTTFVEQYLVIIMAAFEVGLPILLFGTAVIRGFKKGKVNIA